MPNGRWLDGGKHRNSQRAAWVAWALFAALVVIVKYNVEPSAGNVFNIYRQAALRWQAGLDLYPAELYFNYFPTAALLFVPLACLPFDIGGALWRALNTGLFALGAWRLVESGRKQQTAQAGFSPFVLVTVLAIPLCWSAARYGQMTLAMAGLMMLATAEIQREAHWRAAVYACVAVALKPPAVVLLLVLVALYPGFRWRALLLCAALVALPFLFQAPHYVASQYESIPAMLHARTDRSSLFPQAFAVFESMGWTVPELQRFVVRVAAALLVLLCSWRVKRDRPAPGSAVYLYALSSCYILLLGEGTEHNTYAMSGPVIGVLAAGALNAGRNGIAAAMAAMFVATLTSHAVMKAFPEFALFAMVKPVVCMALLAIVLALSWTDGLMLKRVARHTDLVS